VAAIGADSEGDCYDEWQRLGRSFDFLPVDDSSILVYENLAAPGVTFCKDACDVAPGCVFYQYHKEPEDPAKQCGLYFAPDPGEPNMRLAIKIDVEVYSVLPANADSSKIGRDLGLFTTNSVSECSKRCDMTEGCVLLVLTEVDQTTFACDLKGGELSTDYTTMYKVSGPAIGAWNLS
jgi:hypothetical protein